MAKKKLGEFLLRLAEDPKLAKDFQTDPQQVVQDENVSQPAINKLKTNDVKKIRDAVVAELGTDAKVALIVFPINLP